MNLGPIENNQEPDQYSVYQDVDLDRMVPDLFLDTANRTTVEAPTGVITYLDYNEEDQVKEGRTALVARTKFFECRTFSIGALIADEQVMDLKALYGIDSEAMIKNSLQEELRNDIQSHLYSMYKDLGIVSRKKNWSKLHRTIENKLGVDIDDILKNDEGVSKRLAAKILSCANKVAADSRRGPANFVVLSKKLGEIIKDCPGFIIDTNKSTCVVEKIGLLGGMEVFVNLLEEEDYIVVGSNTTEKNANPGVFMGEYKNFCRTFTIVDNAFIPKKKIEIISRRGIVSFGTSPEKSYYTLKVRLSSEINPVQRLFLSMFKNPL